MAKKLTVPFIKIPHQRNPALLSVSVFCRGLASELYMHSANYSDSGYDPSPIPVYGDWRIFLAKQLQVDSRDRGNFCSMLDRLAKVGVLVVEDDFVHVRYAAPKRVPAQAPSEPSPPTVRRQSADSPPTVRSTSVDSPLAVRTDLTPCNDSTHEIQIREEKIRSDQEERETRATPIPISIGPLEMLIRVEFSKRLESASSSTPNQRALGALVRDLVPWVRQTAPLRKLTESELVSKTLDGFFASDRAKSAGYPPAYLGNNPLEYLDPPALKPPLKAAANGGRYAGPSVVGKPEDYLPQEDDPW